MFCSNREGRRASDGLVAQGILHSQSDHPLDSTVAFNSQRLHEACKAKGVLELHLLQKEAAQLKTQYQANIPADEMTVRQNQHTQFHVSPKAQNNKHNHELYHSNSLKNADGYLNKAGDLAVYGGYCGMKNENGKLDGIRDKMNDSSSLQKPPLQQQLMQHRLLQQKRQILQKQVALENGLSRRQMLRQQSYKIAQTQQVLPPLPLNEIESEDLLAFQAIVEGSPAVQKHLQAVQQQQQSNVTKSPCSSPCLLNGSPKIMKTSHIQQQTQQQPIQQSAQSNDCWNNLSGSMQTCQISDNSMNSDNNWIAQSPLYQVYFSNR